MSGTVRIGAVAVCFSNLGIVPAITKSWIIVMNLIRLLIVNVVLCMLLAQTSLAQGGVRLEFQSPVRGPWDLDVTARRCLSYGQDLIEMLSAANVSSSEEEEDSDIIVGRMAWRSIHQALDDKCKSLSKHDFYYYPFGSGYCIFEDIAGYWGRWNDYTFPTPRDLGRLCGSVTGGVISTDFSATVESNLTDEEFIQLACKGGRAEAYSCYDRLGNPMGVKPNNFALVDMHRLMPWPDRGWEPPFGEALGEYLTPLWVETINTK